MKVNALQSIPIEHTNLFKKDKIVRESFEKVMNDKNHEEQSKVQTRRGLGAWVFVREGAIDVGHNIVYAKDSTPENPILCLEDGTKRVEINSVDMKNATDYEMRMCCAYLDANGKGTGSPMGTYNDLMMLKLYEDSKVGQAERMGAQAYTFNDNYRYNWLEISDEYLDILFNTDKKQYQSQLKLNHVLKEFNNHPNQK